MKKLALIIAGAFISVIALAQAPRNDQNPNTQTTPPQPNIQNHNDPYQRTADPTILNPAPLPNSHIQKVDSPAYMQRNDSARRNRDNNLNNNYRRNRVDSLPRDDRDPNRIRRTDRDSIK